jgi:hypothetical protein
MSSAFGLFRMCRLNSSPTCRLISSSPGIHFLSGKHAHQSPSTAPCGKRLNSVSGFPRLAIAGIESGYSALSACRVFSTPPCRTRSTGVCHSVR